MRRLAVLLVALLLTASCHASPSSPQTPTMSAAPSTSAALSAAVVATAGESGRVRDITVRSPAVGADVPVRLILPAAFDSEPARRFPVLYLLHGCCDTYQSWTLFSDVERLVADAGVLVVMPDAGAVGFYSDWLSGPHWETFHVDELWQLLQRQYRASGVRAVAGLSMGGLGSLDYAARHAGAFRAAASFSGVVHTRLSGGKSDAYAGLVRQNGGDPAALWGDPINNSDVWAAHNPYDLAAKLRGVRLFVSAGDGRPGPLDPAGTGLDGVEQSIHDENAALADRLRELGIPAQVDLYGPGTHTWPYWERELHRAWPMLRAALTAP